LWFRNRAKTLLLAVDVVQENCKDIAAGSCCGSGKVQRHCFQQVCGSGKVQRHCFQQVCGSGKVQRHFCQQLLWFRNRAKTLPLAVDIDAGSCCGSGKVQRHCCWQLWFRESTKTLLLAVVVVQQKYKDIAAGSCGSGKAQRHCC
jgi:hypothetical protein